MKRNDGITLIALTVTIIVLIILAGISIGALTGENGIIKQAKQAKEETEISEEKEIIDISVIQAIDEDIMGNIEKENLQNKLNTNAGNEKTEVIDSGETTVVKFIEKDRYYEIDEVGNVEGPKELIKDANAGDLTKGDTCDGTESKPFQINCIEDLVAISIMANGGNTALGLKSNSFLGQYVSLMRTLNFKSIFSYNDYTTTIYGDLNTDGIVEDIRTELTKVQDGCIGFTPIKYFTGTFDGNNYEIKNIYISSNLYAGLFGTIHNAVIKNIGVTGKITGNITGGITGISTQSVIKNVYNVAEINSEKDDLGGICGRASGTQIINVYNQGKIAGYGCAGGIVGKRK